MYFRFISSNNYSENTKYSTEKPQSTVTNPVRFHFSPVPARKQEPEQEKKARFIKPKKAKLKEYYRIKEGG